MDEELRRLGVNELVTANRGVRKARRLLDGPEGDWGSSTPYAEARTAARRCGAA